MHQDDASALQPEASVDAKASARVRLPPLNALRAFEAAARHGNFTRAAKELNVTQSAVSYQVKFLEERLGAKLFQRTASGLVLTAEAEEYFGALRHAFDTIANATARVRSSSSMTKLTISTFPQFAQYWLLPRLPDFAERHPDIQISVMTAVRTLDLDRHGIDVAVRWGAGWSEFDCHLLFSATVFPVCSPRLLEGPNPLRHASELGRFTWLDVEGGDEDWAMWFQEAGIPQIQPHRSLRFDSMVYALQAASEGLGVAMARLPLAAVELQTERVVEPFDVRCRSTKAWYLLVPRLSQSFRKVKTFTDWITEQARQTRLKG